MNIIEKQIDELVPYVNNPRINEQAVDYVAASIKEFGFKNPIIIDKNNVIVAGHTRREAAKRLGLDKVPCILADDLTEQQVKAFRLADNKVAEMSTWDDAKLQIELEALNDIDMSMYGFEELEQEAEEFLETVEDELPEEVETRAALGDIWQLGEHRLICGDSTDPETVKKLVKGGRVDLLLTDPPYNVNVGSCDRPKTQKNNVHILNDNMDEAVFIDWLSKALNNANEVMKPGAAFYIFYAGLHHTEFDYATRKVPEWTVHEQLIWVKGHFVLGRHSDYQWQHEPALYGWKQGAEHYFTDSRAERTVIEDSGTKLSSLKKGELIELCQKLMNQDAASTVLRADKPSAAELHPTVKPQELIAYLMRNSSRKGENVLDLFGGSGSTLIACEQLKRKCYMAELDPKYCDVILKRWELFTGQIAEKITE